MFEFQTVYKFLDGKIRFPSDFSAYYGLVITDDDLRDRLADTMLFCGMALENTPVVIYAMRGTDVPMSLAGWLYGWAKNRGELVEVLDALTYGRLISPYPAVFHEVPLV